MNDLGTSTWWKVLGVTILASAGCKFDAPLAAGDDVVMADAQMEACGPVPAEGRCEAGQVVRCVDGALQHEMCAADCVVANGVASCSSSVVDCAGVGPLGRCDGDALARCDATTSVTDCASSGQVCGYVDDAIGYGCITPATYRVAGSVTWEDRALEPGVLGPPVATAARGTMVSVLDDATDAVLATVSTADDGSYVAYYEATGTVRVAAYSRSRATARPARVRDAAGYLHAIGSQPFAAGATAPVHILVTADSTIGGAWNALDNAVTAMDWLRAHGEQTIAPVVIYWQLGSATGSFYQGGDNSLHLDGDDGFDDVVTLHELGHYVQDEYSRSDNPGGSHDGSPADPRLAWGEGSATWFAITVRGVPYYIDWSVGGGWSVELENRVHGASRASSMSQPISEWMVAELLWDVGDGVGGDDDPMNGSAADVFAVLASYLPQNTARGVSGVDLVDFLDGWFMQQGMTSCGPMQGLVVGRYGFPYDFAGPAGVCP